MYIYTHKTTTKKKKKKKCKKMRVQENKYRKIRRYEKNPHEVMRVFQGFMFFYSLCFSCESSCLRS